jgi:hypothetical protein
MSSLTAHFPWIEEEKEEGERRAIRGGSKRVTWNSSVQVRSISPRPRKVGGEMGPPTGYRPPVGLLGTGHGAENLEGLDNKENKDKTLVSLRMLSLSTKALVGRQKP